jgi:hypothetical protein
MNAFKLSVINELIVFKRTKRGGCEMFNPKITEYWNNIFKLIGKDGAAEKELVFAMLNFHSKEPTATNQTRCLNKIFKDTYREYLLYDDNGTRIYKINLKKGMDNE